MEKYKKTKNKLTLLYFGIIFFIVLLFSLIVLHIQQAQFARFDNPRPPTASSRFRDTIPSPYRENLNQITQERDAQIKKAIDESKKEFLTELIALDIIILAIAFIISDILSKKTLKPIIDSYEAQKKFVADASHELRTPIASMKSETDVILRSKRATEEDYRETLKSINQELDTLTYLSSNLLDIAKSDDHKTKLNLENTNLSEIVNKVVAKFQKIASKKNIIINTSLENITLLVDKYKIEQLVKILLDNAIKYNKEGGSIYIMLSTENNNAKLIVSDTGVGITKEHLDKIFDRFYRVSADRNKKGFGLGLSIAKQIVEEHKGLIKVESKEGEGTKFIVTLPENKI